MRTFKLTNTGFLLVLLCAFIIVTMGGWFFTGYLVDHARRALKTNVDDANLIISLHLINELKRVESAAVAIAGSPLTLPVLQANNPANMEKINNILDRYHKSLDAAACYLIDANGLTLASSNRNAKDSFVGQNYTFRQYFQDALRGGNGRYFAYGTVSKRRGFYAAAPVRDTDGAVVGVVAIKKELDDIENKLKQYIWFLADANGIVFLSSREEARLKSLWPMDETKRQKIIQSKQFGPGPFEPLMPKAFQVATEITFQGARYLTAKQATPYEGIFVMLLWPTEQIATNRTFGIVLTLLMNLLILSFITVMFVFDRSNRRTKRLLEESRSQATALAESEKRLQAQKNELESQKAELLAQRQALERSRGELAQSEERSRLILGSVGEGIIGLGGEGEITFVNPSAVAMLGYTQEELVGHRAHEKVHHSHTDGREFPLAECPMHLSGRDGIVRTVDNEVLWRKDGSALTVEYTTNPVWKEGKVIGTVVSFRDITVRKEADALKVGKEVAEEALVRAEQARREAESAQEDLRANLLEIERFNRLSRGREERIIELKRQVNELTAQAGVKPFYQELETEGDSGDDSPREGLEDGDFAGGETSSQAMAEMLGVGSFQRLLEDFCDSVGIASAIIDPDGKILASARWQRACTDFHRVNEKTCARCIESDTQLALKLSEGKPFSIYRCKNGLTDAASPIIVDGKHIANTFVGQFFTEPPDMEYFRRQAEECGFDQDKYTEAILEVPIVAEEKLESILGFLLGISQLVTTMSIERDLARRAEIALARQVEASRRERMAAVSLAEDAQKARDQLEQYKNQLELLIRERTDELRTSEERSRLILNSVGDGLFGLDKDGTTTFVNPAAVGMLGFSEKELVGQPIHEKVHQAYPDGTHFPLEKCPMHLSGRDGVARSVDDEVFWRKDGSAVQVEYTTTPIRKNGDIVGTVVSFHDITVRKEAQEYVNAYFNSSSDGLLILSPEHGFTHANQAAAALFGFENIADLLQCGPVELSPPYQPDGRPSQEAAMEYITKAMQMSTPLRFDWIHRRNDGTDLPCEIALIKITLAGKPLLLTNIRDIRERKQAEQALAESRERLQRIFDASPLAVAISVANVIRFCNPRFTEWFGLSVGVSVTDYFVQPEDLVKINDLLKVHQMVANYEIQMYGANRKIRDFLISLMRIEHEGKRGVLAWLMDITERKAAEVAVRRAEERSRAILNSISVGTFIIDPKTKVIEDVNPVAARMVGLSREDIIGRTCHKFVCPKEEYQCPITDLGQMIDNSERVVLNAEGEEIPVIKTVVPISLGDHEYLLESFIDITERKQIEEELKERMEELERFNLITINRELKMIELKEEINALLIQTGGEEKYKVAEA